MSFEIRGYRPADDHPACRGLWVELTQAHRGFYDDDSIGGNDPGAEFEEYLTRLELSGMWVAEDDGEVIGFTGLLVRGRHGEVEPLVVGESVRREGVGTALLERVAEEAGRRGLEYLTIQPVTRNIAGLHCFHDAGYTAMSQVTLTKDLAERPHEWRDGIELHGLRFTY
ncbi:MAG TPA: GNAT family N-acetyltransferase [Stackebrandtia sp.]|jgi:GNAT superfamily N-acetyltransferase|uniref:GNAT family N-acetyltransferase n=1 Tax=Stackebrandtia sp. TaxID=2023065 RepID=UPI002D270D6A|nr:GNAT family N-acetyltransferase [Stackebrandtia sp.]HZE38611.1 GNAT family N-acetyltransferase [Stackebrandtia sp.]